MNIKVRNKAYNLVIEPKKAFKVATSFVYILAIVFILLIGGVTFLSALKIPGGVRVHTVSSGSMEPAIKTGSIIVVKLADTYKVGDVIIYKPAVYRNEPNPPTSTTHRIQEIKEDGGIEFFVTKGDANDQVDAETVDKGLVMGKVFVTIPFIGYLTNYIKTVEGLILLIIIPSVVIIYDELLKVKREVKNVLERRRKEKDAEVTAK